jgi:Ca-activated chloride channel family protein
MTKTEFTYRIKSILFGIIVWELIFWILTGFLFFLLGIIGSTGAQKIGFSQPENLYLLLLLLPVVGFYFYNLLTSNRLTNGTSSRIQQLIFQPVSSLNSFLRFFFYRNAFVLMIFALAQPVYGTRKAAGTIESLELVICLDVSNSMNTKDISPELSRLQIAKRALNQFINNLHGEKIGVCIFAGGAFVQLPLTSDYSAAKLFVNDIETEMVSNQGTNIDAALMTSMDMFSKDKTSKGIIMVTDGENHEENPSAVLTQLKEKGIKLSVLGIGTTNGGPVPVNPYRPELGYKTNAVGSTVVSRINPSFIRSIAAKGGGSALITSDEFPDLSQLLTQINQMKRTKVRDLQFDMKENRYQYPLFLGLLFWLLYLSMNSWNFKFSKKA